MRGYDTIGEGEQYAPLVLRSHAIWRELEAHNDGVLLVSACSGHGFKHSAGLDEAVAGFVEGRLIVA